MKADILQYQYFLDTFQAKGQNNWIIWGNLEIHIVEVKTLKFHIIAALFQISSILNVANWMSWTCSLTWQKWQKKPWANLLCSWSHVVSLYHGIGSKVNVKKIPFLKIQSASTRSHVNFLGVSPICSLCPHCHGDLKMQRSTKIPIPSASGTASQHLLSYGFAKPAASTQGEWNCPCEFLRVPGSKLGNKFSPTFCMEMYVW